MCNYFVRGVTHSLPTKNLPTNLPMTCEGGRAEAGSGVQFRSCAGEETARGDRPGISGFVQRSDLLSFFFSKLSVVSEEIPGRSGSDTVFPAKGSHSTSLSNSTSSSSSSSSSSYPSSPAQKKEADGSPPVKLAVFTESVCTSQVCDFPASIIGARIGGG